MGQTREGPRKVREVWEEALGRGLRLSIMSPLVLGSVDFANYKCCWQRVRGRARVSYRFCQDDLFRSR